MAMPKLNILVLHRLGDPFTWRESMVEKELCLPKFMADHNYLVHDFWLPLPEYVKEIAFDAIVLTQTFLGGRQDPGMRARMESVYGELLRCSSSLKIALPQDDYTCSAILDRLLCKWNVDIVYPVCVNDWDVLYPEYSKTGKLNQGFTGYINNELIARTSLRKPINQRRTDVAYRAAHLLPVFGRLGQVKTDYGKRFLNAAAGLPVRTDISIRPQDTILGTRWYDFIEDTRCMLGVNSGSSLLDPEGLINEKVFQYLQRYPKASFEEVEAACFSGLDGQYEFTAISPRNIECALFGTVQVLAPGPYGNFLQPWEHFIPLEPDMSNFADVAPLLSDHVYLKAMAERCREAILSYSQLRYSNHVLELVEEIHNHTALSDTERGKCVPLIERHQREMAALAPAFWRKQRVTNKVRQTLGDLGLRRMKYWIKG